MRSSINFPKLYQRYFYEHLNTFCSIYIYNIFICNRTKKKTLETGSTNFSKIAKNRFPIQHRQMRVFCSKNQIFKPDNNTKKYVIKQKKIQIVFDCSIF